MTMATARVTVDNGAVVNPETTEAATSSQPLPKRPRTENNADQQISKTRDAVFTLGDPDLLDCPICYLPLRSPVYQCDNGHLVCESCCKKIHSKCPSCSLPVGSIRCRAIERVVESALTSCVYVGHGCTEKVSYLKKLEHEKTCQYIPLSCPYYKCGYIGEPKSLYQHHAQKHPKLTMSFSFNTIWHKFLWSYKYILLQEINEKILFVLHRVPHPLGSFVNVACVAPPNLDMKFSYELTVITRENSINLRSSMELTLDICAIPAEEKCHLIRNDFHACENLKWINLQLVIRKVN